MKKCIVRGLIMALIVVGTQASEVPSISTEPVTGVSSRTREAGRVTHQRIKNAIARQDIKKVKQLIAKQGFLEKAEKDDLLKKAQSTSDHYEEASKSFMGTKEDLVMTIVGGITLAVGVFSGRSHIFSFAKAVHHFVKDSLSVEESPEISSSSTVPKVEPMTPGEAWKKLGNYVLPVVLAMGGIRALKRGLNCSQGSKLLQEARQIEQVIYGSIEVGSVPLNVTQD